ncbi:conserved hypothetical protein [Carnobacterium maltaromaticum]|jgi:hypothetical protein|nr:conserved hypothetical protein [Carnobacterium maltaromaticum]
MLQLAANYSDDECQLINDFLGQAIDVLDHELQTD